MSPIEFGVIGRGWRAEFFLRVAQAAPERFKVAGMAVRQAEHRDDLSARFGVRCYPSAEELLDQASMQFVVVSVPHAAAADMVVLAAEAGVPALCETSLAGTLDYLTDLWERCQARKAKVQIAEQYPLQPNHAARLAVLDAGYVGTPSYIHLSYAHAHHAMALIRRALRIGFESPTVRGQAFTAPIIEGPTRAGLPTKHVDKPCTQHLVTYDYGDKLALHDHCGEQYMSYIRGRRVLVRGKRGELDGDRVTYLKDFATPLALQLTRHERGVDGKMDGVGLLGISAGDAWVYRNPFPDARLSDEEIAVGTCMLKMQHYVETGEDFYCLAEACQDAYLGVLGAEATQSDGPLVAQPQPWAAT